MTDDAALNWRSSRHRLSTTILYTLLL